MSYKKSINLLEKIIYMNPSSLDGFSEYIYFHNDFPLSNFGTSEIYKNNNVIFYNMFLKKKFTDKFSKKNIPILEELLIDFSIYFPSDYFKDYKIVFPKIFCGYKELLYYEELLPVIQKSINLKEYKVLL